MKKYRSIDGKDKRLALGCGNITTVGAEWRELPDVFRNEALAQGCIDEDMAKGIAEAPAINRNEEIATAINTMLDGGEEGSFNADGSPNMKKINELCGFAATKEEVVAAWKVLSEGGE